MKKGRPKGKQKAPSKPAEKVRAVQLCTTTLQLGEITVSGLVVLTNRGDVLQYSPRHDPPWTKFPALPDSVADLDIVETAPPRRVD